MSTYIDRGACLGIAAGFPETPLRYGIRRGEVATWHFSVSIWGISLAISKGNLSFPLIRGRFRKSLSSEVFFAFRMVSKKSDIHRYLKSLIELRRIYTTNNIRCVAPINDKLRIMQFGGFTKYPVWFLTISYWFSKCKQIKNSGYSLQGNYYHTVL